MICSTSTESERTEKSDIEPFPTRNAEIESEESWSRRSESRRNGRSAWLEIPHSASASVPHSHSEFERGSDPERPVDDDRHRQPPEADAGEQRSIVQQHFRRAPAAFLLVNQVEVAEDAVQRKWNREPQ